MSDAGPDVTTSDASDAGNPFGDAAYIDSYVVWCSAGPPEFVGIINNLCSTMLYVPCGLPPDDFIMPLDAAGSLGANQMNRCDQVCTGYSAKTCEVMTNGAVGFWLALLDSGADAAVDNDANGDDAAIADAAIADGADPDAIPSLNSPLYVSCDCSGGGRRPVGLVARRPRNAPPLGRHFAAMAHLEAASVPAFSRMRAELSALGASPALLTQVDRAIADERRHARVTSRLARRFGGVVERPRVRRFRPRGPEAIARENVVEGCVRETFGALVLTWQASRARDPVVRAVMARIAADETRHAALALETERFLATKLGRSARKRVERARLRAVESLRAELAVAPHPAVVQAAGVPDARDATRMLDALQLALWTPRLG